MKWEDYPYDEPQDGVSHGFICKTTIGDFVVDYSPWIKPKEPWIACWYPVKTSDEVLIAKRGSSNEAKAAVEAYVARLVTELTA